MRTKEERLKDARALLIELRDLRKNLGASVERDLRVIEDVITKTVVLLIELETVTATHSLLDLLEPGDEL